MRDLQARKDLDDISRNLRFLERKHESLVDRVVETEQRLDALLKHLSLKTTRADIVVVPE